MAIKLEDLFYTLDMKTAGFIRGVDTASAKSKGFSDFMRVAIPAGAAAAGAALVALGAKASQMAANFEQGIAEVGTLVDTNVVNMGELREGVLDIFENVPVENVEDLTRGLYQMISAGVPAERAIADLSVAANAAVGGVTSVETAVDGLTTVMNAFAAEGLTSSRAADSFFTAVKLGKTTFEEISSGIGRVAGLAASLGVTLDDLLGNMVALTKGGLGTRQAFTGLQQILVNIAKPNEKLKKDFPELAEAFDLARLKADGLSQFMIDLAGELQGNDAAAVSFFGSVEALNAAFSLASDGGEQITEIMNEFAVAQGAASEAANKMRETTQATFQQMQNKFAVLMIDLGTKILPLVNAELEGIIGLIDLLSGKVGEIKADTAISNVEQLAGVLRGGLGDPRLVEDIERLRAALEMEDIDTSQREAFQTDLERMERQLELQIQTAKDLREGIEDVIDTSIFGIGFPQLITDLTREQALAVEAGLEALLRTGQQTDEQAQILQARLNELGAFIEDQGFRPEVVAGAAAAAGAAPAAPGEEPVELTAEQIERLNELREQAQELVDAASVDFVAKARQALEAFRADVIAAGGDLEGEFSGAVRALEDAVASAELAAALDPQLQAVAQGLRDATTIPELGEAGAILNNEIIPALEEEIRLSGEGTKRREAANKKLKDAQRLQKQLADQANTIRDEALRDEQQANEDRLRREQEIADEIREQRQEMLLMVGSIEAAVGGVIRLGQAFGLLSDDTAQLLNDVMDIGAGVGRIAAGDIVGGGLQALGGVAGFVGGLFGGESEETKRIRRANTRAIEQLSKDFRKASQFLGATTGAEIGRLQALGDEILRIRGTMDSWGSTIRGMAQIMGLAQENMDELIEAGKQLGITFEDETKPSFEEIIRVAQALEQVQFERFLESFTGSMELLMREFELFDIDDPIEKIRRILDLFLEFTDLDEKFPGADRFLRGIDLTSEEGRRELEKTLQELFQQFRAGTIDPSVIGELTPQEFLEQLTALEALLDEANKAAEATSTGGTTQFAVRRTITEVTGSRIAALLTTGVFFQEQTAENTARMVEMMGGQAFEPIGPPVVGGGGGARGGVSITIEEINVGGVGAPEEAREVGNEIGAGIAEEIDRALGAISVDTDRANGSILF